MKRFIGLVVAAVLILSMLTGCGGPAVAGTNNGKDIPAGVYILSVISATSEAREKTGVSDSKLWNETIDGVPVLDYIKDNAVKQVKRLGAIDKLATELNITFDASDEAMLNNNVDYIMSIVGDTYNKNGIGRQSVYQQYRSTSLEDKLFKKYYGEDGVTPVTEDQLKDEFARQYIKVSMMSANLAALSEDDKAKTREIFKENAAALALGASIGELAAAYEDSLTSAEALEAHNHDEHPGEKDYEGIIKVGSTDYAAEVMSAFESTEVGSSNWVETDDTIYCFIRKNILEDTADFEQRKETVLYDMKKDEFDEMLNGLADAYEGIVMNEQAISSYSPKNLKLS